MAACRIERTLSDPAATVVRAKAECAKFNSVWDGDGTSGRFVIRTPLGTLTGTYSVTPPGRCCWIVEDKPRIIPCALIERILDEFLRAGER